MSMGKYLLGAALTLCPLMLQAADLTITVINAGPKGDIRLRLHDSEAGFANGGNPLAQLVLRPRDGQTSITLHGLSAGAYAAAAFQDVDGKQVLNTNFLGIPSEPYGMSNDASSPDFAKAAFTLSEPGGTITIRLR